MKAKSGQVCGTKRPPDLGTGERVKAHMHNGVAYYREIGVEHDVINRNDFECAFVEVELLEPRANEVSAGQ